MSGNCRPDVGPLSFIWRGICAVDAPWSSIPEAHNAAHEVFHGYVVKYTGMGMVSVTFFNHQRRFGAETQAHTFKSTFYYPGLIFGRRHLPFKGFCFLSCRPGLCTLITSFLSYPHIVFMEVSG